MVYSVPAERSAWPRKSSFRRKGLTYEEFDLSRDQEAVVRRFA